MLVECNYRAQCHLQPDKRGKEEGGWLTANKLHRRHSPHGGLMLEATLANGWRITALQCPTGDL